MSALHTDFYQLNIGLTYFRDQHHEKRGVFEVYFRENPYHGPAIFCGLEKILDVIENLCFTEDDIVYLRSLGVFPEDYLAYLANLRFTGRVDCVREGELVFANEPILVLEAPLIEAHLLETIILSIINYQTLIASKAGIIKRIVKADRLFEYGARRAHETEAALWGARAAIIGGFDGTSLIEAGKRFDLPVVGTQSHAMIQVYASEREAFAAYARSHRDCVFLVDTYDALASGVPNAIAVAREFAKQIDFKAIRIDSGDLAYLSKAARKMLDAAGYSQTKIIASNDLDEETIVALKNEGAKIDYWGIGTKLITGHGRGSLGAVYKLVSVETEPQQFHDVIKISNNLEKITTPGRKQTYRLRKKTSQQVLCDYVALASETPDPQAGIAIFEPQLAEVITELHDVDCQALLQPVVRDGKRLPASQSVNNIRDYHQQVVQGFSAEHLRYKNPETFHVYLSRACYDNKVRLLKSKQGKVDKQGNGSDDAK